MAEDEENSEAPLHNIYSTKKLSELQKNTLSETIGIKDSDFIKIRFNRIPPKEIRSEIENVVITSQNGVEALLNSFTRDEMNFKNIYCVGRRTKKLIENRIGKVTHVAKNAQKLGEHLANQLENKTGADDDTRMIFDKSKGAFRAGRDGRGTWNESKTGKKKK